MNPREHKSFEEFRAIQIMQDLKALDGLAWHLIRRGDANSKEPDWVIESPVGDKPIGIEVTQPPAQEMFRTNSEIAARLRGKKPGRRRGKDLAGDGLALAGGDIALEFVVQAYVKCTVADAERIMMKAIDEKKERPAYKGGKFALHLVIYEPMMFFTIVDGTYMEVLERIAHKRSDNLVGLWHIRGSSTITRLLHGGRTETLRKDWKPRVHGG